MEDQVREAHSYDVSMMVDVEKLKVIDQPMPPIGSLNRSLLVRSIKEFGIKEAIRIDSEFNVLAGRNRLEIAKELKMKTVPCVISNTKDNPSEQILKYDMELARRNLSSEEMCKLVTERNKYYDELRDNLLKQLLDKIIPELKDNVNIIWRETGDMRFIKHIASQSPDIQKELVSKVEIVLDDKINGKTADELKRLAKSERELGKNLKIMEKDHKKLKNEFDEINEMLTMTMGGMKEEIAAKITAKEKEFKDKYSSTAPAKLKKLFQEERERIEGEVRDQLDDLNKSLKEMSLTVQNKSNDIERLNEELKNIKQAKTDIEAAKKNTDNHLKEMKTVIEGLARPQKFVTRLEGTLNDINNTFQGLVEVGIDAFNTEHRKLMEKLLEQINTVSLELNDLLRSGDKVKSANGNGKKKTKK